MSIKRTMAGVLLVAVVAGLALQSLPAGAHAGHAPPIITIDKPAAGTLYVNDVAQPGSIGGAANTAWSVGNPLTPTVSWACPPQSTGSHVTLVITDGTGAKVYDMGLGAFGPKGSHSPAAWKAKTGTYKITATVECIHLRQVPHGVEVVSDGTDTDTRNVIVL